MTGGSTIGDLIKALIDYRGKTPSKTISGVPLITAKVIKGGIILDEPREYIAADNYDAWMRRGLPASGDILITTEAPLGEVARVGTESRIALAQRVILLRPDSNKVDPSFMFHYLRSPQAQAALKRRSSGTTVSGIRQPELRALEVPLLGRPAQEAVGVILDSIDDLIANNRRRVEVLEEMARAIYREWFVKFRYPGHGDVPLVDSVLGPIPEGWGAGKIGQLCSRVQAGATPRRSTPEYWDEPAVDWYKTGDLTDGVLLGSSEKLSDAGFEIGRTFKPETILMAIYGSPTVGRLGLLTSTASANQAALGLVADPDVCTTEYLWFALESLRGHLNQIAQGAAQQNVSKQKVIGCDVLMPPREVVEDFTLRAAPAWRLSHALARQTAALESLRDLLLPKLVTGQIDVSELDLDALIVEQVA